MLTNTQWLDLYLQSYLWLNMGLPEYFDNTSAWTWQPGYVRLVHKGVHFF